MSDEKAIRDTVHGDWTLTRVDLDIETTPTSDAQPMKLAGRAMTVWRKHPGVIWRDANMVAPVGT